MKKNSVGGPWFDRNLLSVRASLHGICNRSFYHSFLYLDVGSVHYEWGAMKVTIRGMGGSDPKAMHPLACCGLLNSKHMESLSPKRVKAGRPSSFNSLLLSGFDYME